METFVKIDSGFDEIIGSNYDLYKCDYSELKTVVKGWYDGIDLSKFDSRNNRDIPEKIESKKSGVLCNLFFGYVENDKSYLIDGFNRLFTDNIPLDLNQTVYLKMITSKLEPGQLMRTMTYLNMWKLYNSGFTFNGFSITDFLDRGLRLFLYSKFDIDLYTFVDYKTRIKDTEDIRMIDKYFIREVDSCGTWKWDYEYVVKLLSNKNIINDLKEIIKSNNFSIEPFDNYKKYFEGYIMFLSFLRVNGDEREYNFEYFLNELYKDKKFFKKLQGMSWTDVTRQNIYRFYRKLDLTDYK